MKWIKSIDGYDEEHLYADQHERIVGEVYGSQFRSHKGWRAILEEQSIGRYLTLEAAKTAIEAAYETKKQ